MAADHHRTTRASVDRYPTRAYARTVGDIAVVLADDTAVGLSRIQQRIVLRLAEAAPNPLHWEDLAEAVWPKDRPATAHAAIQNQISRIRAVAGDTVISTIGDGYVLGIDTDLSLLTAVSAAAQYQLTATRPGSSYPDGPGRAGVTPNSAESADAAFRALDRILAALPLGPDHLRAAADDRSDFRQHSGTIISTARAVRLAASLQSGRWAWALIEAEQIHADAPLDEQAAANYARALAFAGRRSEALSVLAQVRRELRLHLGVDSGPHLDAAEREVLTGTVGLAADQTALFDRTGSQPLVGRGDEIRVILQQVARRHPVCVRGEHGSGVSRVLFEARAKLVSLGVRALLVRAEENPHSATSLVEELLAELGAEIQPPHSALTTFEAAVGAIDTASPTVFLIDDVQFLGPTAWQAIRAVVAADHGGLVLGGHGQVVELPDEVDVELGPLDDESVAAMARHWGIEDPEAVADLVTASGGNPLAVRLLASDLSNRGETRSQDATYGRGLDGFIDHLIGDRDAERLHDLQLAAVAADGYPLAAFEHLDWPHSPAPPADLIDTNGGVVRFRHGAVQDHIYRSVPRGVLLDMHYALGTAARAIDASAGTVARHLVAAAELDPPAAIDAARAAADAAVQLGAHADAAEWLRQAREIAEAHPSNPDPETEPEHRADCIRLEIEYGDALRMIGHPDHMEVLTAAAEAAVDFGDDELIAAAGFVLLQLGGSSPAGALDPGLMDLMERVINSITDTETRAPVQAAASLALSLTGHADMARALFDAAEAAAHSPAVRLKVLPFVYLALGLPGDLPRRRALAGELTELAAAYADVDAIWEAHHLWLSVAIQEGDGARVRAELGHMEGLVDQLGDVGTRWCTLYCAATVAEMGGDAERAEELAARAYRTFYPTSPDRAAAAYYAQLLPLRMRDGRLAELWPTVETLVAEQPGVTGWHAAAALILAEGADSGEERDRARDHARAALDLAQADFTWLAAHMTGGRAAALLQDRELAERYAARLEPWSDLVCWQGTCSYGPVAEVLALLYDMLGDKPAAVAAAQVAAELQASLAAAASRLQDATSPVVR